MMAVALHPRDPDQVYCVSRSGQVFGTQNAGQTCISIERVYVESDAYEPFVAKVVEKVSKLRQGTGAGPDEVEIGAMTSPEQADLVQEHLRDAVEKGAKIETGGTRRPGNVITASHAPAARPRPAAITQALALTASESATVRSSTGSA